MIHQLKHVFAIAALVLPQFLIPVQAQTLQELASYKGEDRHQRLVEGAKKEGSLLWYTTTPVPYAKLLIEPFEKKYGIKVNLWRARPEVILQKVISEARGGSTSPGGSSGGAKWPRSNTSSIYILGSQQDGKRTEL